MNRLIISDLYIFKTGIVYNFGKKKLEAIHVFLIFANETHDCLQP